MAGVKVPADVLLVQNKLQGIWLAEVHAALVVDDRELIFTAKNEIDDAQTHRQFFTQIQDKRLLHRDHLPAGEDVLKDQLEGVAQVIVIFAFGGAGEKCVQVAHIRLAAASIRPIDACGQFVKQATLSEICRLGHESPSLDIFHEVSLGTEFD
ncbi:MAG: hypothetical protein WD768_17730 [Phycisphaeraceae bacterium]